VLLFLHHFLSGAKQQSLTNGTLRPTYKLRSAGVAIGGTSVALEFDPVLTKEKN